MKTLFTSVFFTLMSLVVNAQHENHAATANATNVQSKSPRKTAMALVGKNHVHIDYGSPSVRGRNIWNGLVAYDQVWATGAHKATWVEFSSDVKIAEKKITKGKYGFFTIPGKDEWVLILNKDWDMHLADSYKMENDLVRVVVKPIVRKEITEALTYKVIRNSSDRGKIEVSWEYLTVSLDFQNL